RKYGGERNDTKNCECKPSIVDKQPGQLAKETHQRAHCNACVPGRRVRTTATRATRRNSAAKAMIATSSPGQGTSRPSPIQNTPNADSMTPTMNLSVFSGTRASG